MANALRWGILATGWIAEQFVGDLLLDGHTVVAVGSRTKEAAEAFARKFGIARAHGTYEALCADEGVDAIYVATPHPMHADNARLALEHGKHVLVEKPFTLTGPEAREVVELAAQKGLVILEAMWTRFLPHMIRLREVLAAGRLGDLRSVIADHTQKLSDDPAHRLNDLALGGGALLDLGIYPISFCWDVLGAPESIKAAGTLKDTGADGDVATLFHYGSGAIAATLSSSISPGPNTASISGTGGRIEIERVWYAPTTIRVYDDKGKETEIFEGKVEGRGMQFQAREVERLVAEGKTESTIMPPQQTVAIMECLDAIRKQIGLVYPGGL